MTIQWRGGKVLGVDEPFSYFREYASQYVPMTEDMWNGLRQTLSCQTNKKKEYLILQGQPFRKEIFVLDGVVRACRTTEEGQEWTTAFYQSGEFVSISTLRNKEGRSLSSYQVLLDGTVLLVETEAFLALLESYPELLGLVEHLKEQEILRNSRREECLMHPTGAQKYAHFLLTYPGLEELIPHYIIASYLGITPVSLSRIRKKLA